MRCKRTAYSFRHTYASNQIRKGTDIYTLAIDMRTSVRMIEMYYSDVVPDEMARQLEGNWDKPSKQAPSDASAPAQLPV